MKRVALGDAGVRYVRSSLRDGPPLARLAEGLLRYMSTYALIPDTFPEEAVEDFRRGGHGGCDIGDVAESLRRLFPNAWLAVGLPLMLPDDPVASGSELKLQVDGRHVYAVCRLYDPSEAVEKTLRAADPSFLYNAAIIESGARDETGGNLRRQVEEGQAWIVAILVGAYDGEGFIMAMKARDDTVKRL